MSCVFILYTVHSQRNFFGPKKFSKNVLLIKNIDNELLFYVYNIIDKFDKCKLTNENSYIYYDTNQIALNLRTIYPVSTVAYIRL